MMAPFLDAVKSELKWACETFDLRPRTVYFGGGTPSALSISQLEVFFSGWPWRDGSKIEEFTFECNPSTVSLKKAELLKQVGVNRISLGVQSFQPEFLKLLGRTHTADGVRHTMEHLCSAGFENISIDLMYALPGQSIESWLNDLAEATELKPQHISAYNLNFEEDTAFFEKLNRGIWQIDEALEREMFLKTVEFLESKEFHFYEISNFARSGYTSVHNQAYWDGKDYLGLGPSACSTVGHLRWKNVPDSHRYIESICARGYPERTEEKLSSSIRQNERRMLALRTRQGIPLSELQEHTSFIETLVDEKRAIIQDGHCKLTYEGMLVADSIVEILI